MGYLRTAEPSPKLLPAIDPPSQVKAADATHLFSSCYLWPLWLNSLGETCLHCCIGCFVDSLSLLHSIPAGGNPATYPAMDPSCRPALELFPTGPQEHSGPCILVHKETFHCILRSGVAGSRSCLAWTMLRILVNSNIPILSN